MAFPTQRKPHSARPPTWDAYKSAVRREDRDSLLILCAGTTAAIARGEMGDEWKAKGLTDWNIADVARTSLAWG